MISESKTGRKSLIARLISLKLNFRGVPVTSHNIGFTIRPELGAVGTLVAHFIV